MLIIGSDVLKYMYILFKKVKNIKERGKFYEKYI